MNLSLLDPFTLAQEYPENLERYLKSGRSTCVRFNATGDLLASGRLDGTVVVFDMETNGLARVLKTHVRQIQSLSWSRDSRYLLSTSQDWRAVLWDLETGKRIRVFSFAAPVYGGDMHPTDPFQFTISLYKAAPYIVDAHTEEPKLKELPALILRPPHERTEKNLAADAKQLVTNVVYTKDGDHVITATDKGWLSIVKLSDFSVIYSMRLSNGCLTYIRLSPTGKDIVVNSNDRIIRTVHIPDLSAPIENDDDLVMTVEHKFQDVVNRLLWNNCTFSSTGEYVAASIYHNHDIYIWERTKGSLVKILEGPKEELGTVEWHPSKPLVVAAGIESGRIFLWSTPAHQRWSALAPDFTELEENIEYIEKEDEFDIHPKEELTKRKLHMEDEDIDVLSFLPGEGKPGWTMPVEGEWDQTESESSDDEEREEQEKRERDKEIREKRRVENAAAHGGSGSTARKRKK
ncbi:WD40 repeat-like protein [Ascobolus immersus RN42]|uniref:WD40 repeat-like protein n=1 Tax=Ascobolus immersus RN42 TaxID=1160509 RepID=A0A3N4HHK3_ASCIM|nr:WD40 repeat-like protein [Ascobolus immersus RN42]